MDMTDAIQEAYAYADPDIAIYETFEITHTSFGASIKIVDSPTSITTTEGTFLPVTMEASTPETESSVRGQMQLTVRFLNKTYRALLFAAAQYADPIYIYYRQYIDGVSDPQAELPVGLTVSGIEFTDDSTVITALYPDLVNILICKRKMTVSNLPGCQI